MRSKTNIILAGMALADILFLVFMAPHSLMSNQHLTKQFKEFKQFLVYANMHFVGVVNMCSFASAWYVLAKVFSQSKA